MDRSDPLAAAEQHLEQGDPQQALRALLPAFPFPDGEAPALLEALALLARIGREMGDVELPALIEACQLAADDSDRWYDVGYHMLEVGLERYAPAVLAEALRLAPGSQKVVSELACALERSQAFGAARGVLRAHPELLEASFNLRYLLAFNAVMDGDLLEPATLLSDLREAASGEREQFMLARIEGLLERAQLLEGVSPLDADDLRGWHWVITGSLLTQRSPHGPEVMHGRYAWLQDSGGLCRLGLDRLAAVLDAWGWRPPRVIGLPERGGQILAHAAAARLGLPLEPWPEGGPQGPALLVGYDLRELEGPALRPLVTRPPGQLLWVHGTCWTEHFPIAPDLTTVLHQTLAPLWESGMIVNADTGTVGRSEVDERPDHVLAAELLEAEPRAEDDDPADREHLLAVARATGCAHLQAGGRREAMWFGSPVGGNFFA